MFQITRYPAQLCGCENFLERFGSRLVVRGHQVMVDCRSSRFRDRPRAYKRMLLIYLRGIETKSKRCDPTLTN